jgi:hypothetical protein
MSSDYFLKNSPAWVRLLIKSALLYLFCLIAMNIGITDYRHEMNDEFVTVHGKSSLISGLVICFIYSLFIIVIDNKIINEIKIFNESRKVEIFYTYFHCKSKIATISFDDIKYEYKPIMGFRYYNYVLKIKNHKKQIFTLWTNRYGWTSEQIKAIENDIKGKIINAI